MIKRTYGDNIRERVGIRYNLMHKDAYENEAGQLVSAEYELEMPAYVGTEKQVIYAQDLIMNKVADWLDKLGKNWQEINTVWAQFEALGNNAADIINKLK